MVTDEVWSPGIVETERTLNNRPLVPVSSDAKEQLPLMPNGLLLLREVNGTPGLDVSKIITDAVGSR